MTITKAFRKIPRRYYFLFGAALILFMIIFIFWPRTVELSYGSAKTCFFQPTIAPGLLRSSGSSDYRLEAEKVASIGNVPIAAINMCIVPVESPKQGSSSVHLAILGLPIFRLYNIVASEPPRLAKGIPKTPLALSKPVAIELSKADALHTYRVVINDKSASCAVDAASLLCDISKLGLKQGESYVAGIERYFSNKRVNELTKQSIQTLEAVSIVDASIKQGQTVFAKPTSIELIADKSIEQASMNLYKLVGTTKQKVETKTTIIDKKVTVSWQSELPRQASYELEVAGITAKDGSGLDGSYKLGFAMSGGPKVTNISVGTYKVSAGAMAVITFDQPVSETQDISQIITASGGARVVGKNGNRVSVDFSGVPRCGDVSIKVTDALKSSYDVAGGTAWSYATRTVCQSIGSIGTSLKGRSIASYSFGNGSNTIVFTGAIHGSEASTRSLMLKWIDELESNVRTIPADKTVVVIPAINPDGIASGSRTNANNVDLNRNFATKDWMSDITTTSNSPFPSGGGKSALSEPEARAVANYIGSVRPKLVLSYHSIGGLLAANQAGDSKSRAATYASLSGYRNTTGSSDAFEYGISGTADDYYAEAYGVPSILIELGSHSDAQFSRNQKALWSMVR